MMFSKDLAEANACEYKQRMPRWFRLIRYGVNRFWNIRVPGVKRGISLGKPRFRMPHT
jgi:NADPH-dependent glutamate synthase beta subunit-like oxidoreductase